MLQLANTILDMAELFPEHWTTKLQVLWRDIVSTTSTISLEAANNKLYLLRTDRTDRVVGLPTSSSSLNLWLGGRSCAEQTAHATVLPRLRPCPAACAAFHTCTCNEIHVRHAYLPAVVFGPDVVESRSTMHVYPGATDDD